MKNYDMVVLHKDAAADGDGAVAPSVGYTSATFQAKNIEGGAVVTPQISADGVNFEGVLVRNLETGSEALTITADGIYAALIPGVTRIKAPLSSYASGAIDVTLTLSNAAIPGASGGGGGAASDVNLIEVGGGAVSLGRKNDEDSIPVTFAVEDLNQFAVFGDLNDAAVSTDADGSINAHIRGLIVNAVALVARFPAVAALSDAFANPSPTQVGAFAMMWDSVAATWRRLLGDSNGLYTWMTSKLDINNDHVVAVPPLVSKSFTPVMSDSPDYQAGDAIGTINTLSSVMEPSPDGSASVGRAARLHSIHAVDKAGQAPSITIYFFKATPAAGTYTDNAAIAWGPGDAANMVGVVVIPTASWKTTGGVSAVTVDVDQIHVSAADSIFTLVMADAAYNGASTGDLIITAGYERG